MSTDYTAIDLHVDPHKQRFTGIATHGRIPFDVPFISEVAPNLYVGGCRNGLVLPDNIKHLVSLYPWEKYTERHELFSRLYVRMYDSASGGVDSDQVLSLAYWVNVCRKMGPTLVHCQAGLNRSNLIAATALVLDGMASDDAVGLLREKRSPAVLCNPLFLEWVQTLADKIDAS